MTELGAWDALAPDEVATLFAGLVEPWWLAGGWAVELAVGRSFRSHGDTDVLVLRPDLLAVQEHLAGGTCTPPTRRARCGRGVRARCCPTAIHDMFCRRTPESPWPFQFMVDAVDGDDWVFRRDPRIRRPVDVAGRSGVPPGLPVLAPEIQLLYKSGAGGPKADRGRRTRRTSTPSCPSSTTRARVAVERPLPGRAGQPLARAPQRLDTLAEWRILQRPWASCRRVCSSHGR